MKIGILGGGQLGRMLALAGYPLGLRFRFFDIQPEAPGGHLATLITGSYHDPAALEHFAHELDMVTYEFENVPVDATHRLAARMLVFPPPLALEKSQDRFVEKSFFREQRIPTPPFRPVQSAHELERAVEELGLPCVLKTRRMGYDGKGQSLLRTPEDVATAWNRLGPAPLILEGFVGFDREVSILAVRGRGGEHAYYPLVENHHREGMLRLSVAPAPRWSLSLQQQAEAHARRVLEALDYVGVLAIEFFVCGDTLVANEMAPRVHNSGHWTIEGAATSQFANHLRAGLGYPLGDPSARGHAAMVNLIGEVPPLPELLAIKGSHVHLYGKTAAPGRKLGHVTLCDDSEESLWRRLSPLLARVGFDPGTIASSVPPP